VRRHFEAFARDIACGLVLRHDHGSQYMADDFRRELRLLGITSSPAFVRAPEGNGCAERFIRTLKENLLWVRSFDRVEELRTALLEFRDTYNTTWLIERHGFRPPAAMIQEQLQTAALAAQASTRCLINRKWYSKKEMQPLCVDHDLCEVWHSSVKSLGADLANCGRARLRTH
jgi:hypothetical protein